MATFKATLIMDGKLWKLDFIGGRKPFFITWTQIPEAWNGKLVHVECNQSGLPIELRAGEEVIKKQQLEEQTIKGDDMKKLKGNKNMPYTKPRQPQEKQNQASLVNEVGHAPYNFIPLNEGVLEAQSLNDSFDCYNPALKSGYFEITITSKTHIYIKGVGCDFFKVDDQYTIPGSSIRGMIRNLAEIIGHGKFVTFNDRSLFRRAPINELKHIEKKIGFLIYKDGYYKIYEAKEKPSPIPKSNDKNKFSYKYDGTNIKIHTGPMNAKINNFEIEYSKKQDEYSIEDTVLQKYKDDDTRNAGGLMEDLLVSAKNESFTKKIPSSSQYIGIPVWFEANGKNVTMFGHCKNFRRPYNHSIGDDCHIAPELRDTSKLDFVESIFGTVPDKGVGITRASKVFFEDAPIQQISGTERAMLKVLANPKPTACALYLEQGDSGTIRTWNDTAKIRGYKQYWHRDTNSDSDELTWRKCNLEPHDLKKLKLNENEVTQLQNNLLSRSYFQLKPGLQHKLEAQVNDKKSKLQFKVINALNPQTNTCPTRIRFENLSDEELGLLQAALQLPEGLCHKLGMGKPLGLGSVRIESKLFIYDLKKKYQNLIENDGNWSQYIVEDKSNYVDMFWRYMQKSDINYANDSNLWSSGRMKDLKRMLNWEYTINPEHKTNWNIGTNYMSFDRENKNKKLPSTSEVFRRYLKQTE